MHTPYLPEVNVLAIDDWVNIWGPWSNLFDWNEQLTYWMHNCQFCVKIF